MMVLLLRVKSSAAPVGGFALDLSPFRDGDLDQDLDRDRERERELSLLLLLLLMVVLLRVGRVMVELVGVEKLGVLGKLERV